MRDRIQYRVHAILRTPYASREIFENTLINFIRNECKRNKRDGILEAMRIVEGMDYILWKKEAIDRIQATLGNYRVIKNKRS
jgi:hypothetical protein